MIPVFEPEVGEDEIQAVVAAMRRGEISGSFGDTIPRFERAFAAYVGTRHAVACSSGTAALQMAVDAVGIGPGDEVLVSASTNIATALAVHHRGATVIPVDSEDVTWNLDLDLVEASITPRTRAIIPVHLFGHPVEMDRLCALAARHHLTVIEDCAESHGATVRGRMTGSFGQLSCFSFYANKIITTGEGGMVLTDDDVLADHLRLLRNLAFTRPRFRHEIAGYNFRMTGMQAAMGEVQLAKIDRFIVEKRRVAHAYNRLLEGIPGIRTPAEAGWARNVYWMYGIVVRPEFGRTRDELAARLLEQGIDTRTFFCPMNLQPCLREEPHYRQVDCPVAGMLWECGLYLPSSCSLDEPTLERIASAVAAARR